MKELLAVTIPDDVGQALLIVCAVVLAGTLGIWGGTASERRATRNLLRESFTDPDMAKTIFVAQWTVSAPPGGEDVAPDELWEQNEYLRQESIAAVRAVHDRVTTDLDL